MGRFAVRAQAIRRGSRQRRLFLAQRAAVVRLQAAWRCGRAQRAFRAKRAAAAIVQRRWRAFRDCREALRLQVRFCNASKSYSALELI